MRPFWITAFLDLPASRYDAAVTFWEGVTGYRASEPRGEHLEFATLVPPEGDAFLRVQRLAEGGPRLHLDLSVDDPRAAADAAVGSGAREVADRGYVVLESPGGFTFCFVGHPGATRPPSVDWADGGHSLVDQVCLDIPADGFDEEVDFWAGLTGWPRRDSPGFAEFGRLERPAGMPLRLLLQRLGESRGRVRAHLDLACEGRDRETRRHQRLGATLVDERAEWTVLRDPAESAYCITDRGPDSGRLAGPPESGPPQ